MYVDAAYCYQPSSMVYRSVTVVSPTKMVEPIEMLFGLRTRVGPRKIAPSASSSIFLWTMCLPSPNPQYRIGGSNVLFIVNGSKSVAIVVTRWYAHHFVHLTAWRSVTALLIDVRVYFALKVDDDDDDDDDEDENVDLDAGNNVQDGHEWAAAQQPRYLYCQQRWWETDIWSLCLSLRPKSQMLVLRAKTNVGPN